MRRFPLIVVSLLVLTFSGVFAYRQIHTFTIAENRKTCEQISNEIMKETGRAFAVGFEANTMIIWGTVDSPTEREEIEKLANSSLGNFKNELLFFGRRAKLLNLVEIAGQPAPANPLKLGVPNENIEPNWEDYLHPSI